MDTIQLTGKYKIENKLTLKDPLVEVKSIFYNFDTMMATIEVKLESPTYSHQRQLDPAPFTKELTNQDIIDLVNSNFTLKKQ